MQTISTLPSRLSLRGQRQRQRGIALYVVIVLVLLSMLLALWAARSALFNEIVVGNDADYRRAFEAAQAMLQDAEFDIRGVTPDGGACIPTRGNSDLCRPALQPGDPSATPPVPDTPAAEVYFDIETKDLENLLSTIEIKQPTIKCYKGICQKRAGAQDFWNDSTTLNAMLADGVGARYGQFTGASAEATANPILADRNAGKGAWYWVEIMPYVDPNISLIAGMPPGSNVERFAPSRKKLFVYRITAFARGNKVGSEVVLQSTLSLQVAE
ncbi:pilus assembly protein [Diaphorobacter sp.]|uniref:pilus assembly PilX family protein n=1 Tax=Diaphorobacter sp. TaxID=1934310 RepID=UPI00258A54BD|nr:pilus assembly protein [Diaphorobacter sp.]